MPGNLSDEIWLNMDDEWLDRYIEITMIVDNDLAVEAIKEKQDRFFNTIDE